MSYSDSIIEAMSTLLGDALAKQKNAKVIEATIKEIIDPTIGLYSLNYLDITIKAYSNNISVSYAEDDKVYVLSQDGTLDGNLIIIGSSAPYSGLYINDNKIQYRPVSETIFFNVNDGQPIELCTWQSPQVLPPEDSAQTSLLDLGINFNTIFSKYLSTYKTFCLSMDVRTDIKDPYQKVNGNYGIILTIPMLREKENGDLEEVNIDYTFDIEKMEGNPYDMLISTPQQIYYTFEDNLIFNAAKVNELTLKAFCKDFRNDNSIIDPDIFLTNIKFYPVEVIDPSILAGNYLLLTASQGNYFVNDRFTSTKVITPTLYVDGQQVSIKNLDTYWFVEDGSITMTSKLYNNRGGVGWKCLNKYSKRETVDGAVEEVLDLTQQTLEVKKEDVKTSLKYKCVIIYNNDVVKQTITIENLSSLFDIDVSIDPSFIVSNSKVTMTCTVTDRNKDPLGEHYLDYIWTRYDEEENLLNLGFYEKGKNYNTFTQIDSNTRQYVTDITFNGNIIQGAYNVIACSVYDVNPSDNSRTLIGTVQKIIALNNNSKYYLSMLDSNKLYKYDADGDSPMVANYDGPISSVIHDIEPLSFKIYKANGDELSETEYGWCITTWDLPKDSMMKFGIDKFKSQGLMVTEDTFYYHVKKRGKFDIPYDILSVFNASKTDNTVLVKVDLNDDEQTVLTGVADIRFLKEGESGTNGTRYSAVLTYQGLGYNVINSKGLRNKLQLVYVANTDEHGELGTGTWYYKDALSNLVKDLIKVENGIPPFGLEVYKDGELIDSTVSYTTTWTIFDEQATKPYFTINNKGRLVPAENNTWSVTTDIRALVIQANVKVTDSSTTSSDQIIYVHYPIEMTRIYDKDLSNMTYLPNIEGGFDSVLYSIDGTEPKYDTTYPFKCNSFIGNEDVKDIFSYYWGSSYNLTVKEDKDDETLCKASPIAKYDNGNANNYIFARMYPNSESTIPSPDGHIQKRNEYLMDIAKKYLEYKELQNLISTFSWVYADEAEEKALREKINKYKNIDIVAAKKKIQDEDDTYEDYIKKNFPGDYETEIINAEKNLNDYVMKLSLLLKNVFESATDVERYHNVKKVLVLQNPKKGDNFSFNALEDNLEVLNNTLNTDWTSLKAQVESETVSILVNDRLEKLIPSDSNYNSQYHTIENQIIAIQPELKALLDKIYSTTVVLVQREQLEEEYYSDINTLIDNYLNDYDSVIIAESNLPVSYTEVDTQAKTELYNHNNGMFMLSIQDIADFEDILIRKNEYTKEHDEKQEKNRKDLETLEIELNKAETSLANYAITHRSEIANWENDIVSNDFLTKREKGLNDIIKALNALSDVKTTFKNLQVTSYDYETKITQLKDKIYLELRKLYNTIKDEDVSQLQKLTNCILELTEAEKQAIKNELGESKIQENITLNEKIKHYNDYINLYNEDQTALIGCDTSKVQGIYQKIIDFNNKLSNFDNTTDYKELIKNEMADFGIDLTDDLCTILSDDIHKIVGTNTTSIDVAVSADNEIINLKNSLTTLLSTFSCDSNAAWDELDNKDKEILSAKNYKDLILKVFFDILKIYYQIINNGSTIVFCVFDDSGKTIALTRKYGSIPNDIVNIYNNKASKEIDTINIINAQLGLFTNKVALIHVKPIVFRTNTYEMSWLNEWDGNKLYTDEDGEYIIAPQIGAGAKNEANQFIGITMGVKKAKDGVNSEIGLFGFSEKGQSIFLDAKTGKSQFGVSGSGQITLDPTLEKDGKARALLYSADFFTGRDGKFSYDNETETGSKTGKGMLIDLSTPCIKFGSGGFWVDKDGNMHVGGTNNEIVEPQPAPGQDIPGTFSGDKYLDGLETFYLVQNQNYYIDTLGNKYTYDIGKDVFVKDGVEYPIVSKETEGEKSIIRRKTSKGYEYSYYDGANKHPIIYISGMYKANITQKGLGSGTREVYFDPTQNKYWFVTEDKFLEIYANKDKYKKYVYYHEPASKNELGYYYYYEDDGTEVKFYYDTNLGVYLEYNKNTNEFFFNDKEGQFGEPGTIWILDPVEQAYFYWDENSQKHYMTNEMSSLGGWRIGDDSIYSENKKMKIYSAYKNDNGNPSVFAAPDNFDNHSTLEATKPGCYLGPDGLSIGDALRATNDKGVFIGKLSNNRKSFWRIYGNNSNSYIYYNAKDAEDNPNVISFENVYENESDNENKIYVGTDGVILGNEFMVDTEGGAGPKGTTYIGNIKKDAFWRFHTKRVRVNNSYEDVAFMFYDKHENGESNALLEHFTEEAKDNVYIGTNGLRIGYNVLLRPGNHTQLFGYLPNKFGRFALYYQDGESGDGSTQSFFYSNRDYDLTSDKDIGGLTANLLYWNTPADEKSLRDVYIGTNGIRFGETFRVDGYIGNSTGGNDKFRVGIMKEDFYLGTKNEDGSITWELFKGGGGGGDLPQAENYSF